MADNQVVDLIPGSRYLFTRRNGTPPFQGVFFEYDPRNRVVVQMDNRNIIIESRNSFETILEILDRTHGQVQADTHMLNTYINNEVLNAIADADAAADEPPAAAIEPLAAADEPPAAPLLVRRNALPYPGRPPRRFGGRPSYRRKSSRKRRHRRTTRRRRRTLRRRR